MVSIFVETEADAALLSRLLSDLLERGACRVVPSGGRDNARPRARKELLVERSPTALVIDADTTEPDRVALQQRELEDYLAWPGHGVPFAVVQFVPAAEVLFFKRPGVLRHIVKIPLNEYIALAAEVAPRKILERLMVQRGIEEHGDFLRLLTDDDVCQLRKTPEVAALRRFVQQNAAGGAVKKSA